MKFEWASEAYTVGFEVLTAVSMKIAVFWATHRPDDGGSKDL
jgi:hypothetical protein